MQGNGKVKEKKGKAKVSLSLKIGICILIISGILSAVAIMFSFAAYKDALNKQLTDTAYNLADTVAAMIEPESIDRYLESGETDDEYWQIRQRLITIVKMNDISYVVIVKPTADGFYYVYDTDETDEAFKLGDFQGYYGGDFADHKQDFLDGKVIGPIVSNYEFGWLLSALVPIKDENGKMCGYVDMDLSMDEIIGMENDFLIRLSAILIALIFMMAVIQLVVTRRVLVKPINRLALETGDFVGGREKDNAIRAVIDVPKLNSKDEIGHLYRSIKRMETDIYTYIDDLTAVTVEKERIGAELGVAKHIQASMLPSVFPAFPERPELDIYATMTPAKEVGGDFYDFFFINDDKLAMVIADVSGKGVPAALFMVITKTLIKNVAQTGLNPSAVLEKVNNQLCVGNEAEMFVTVWLGILEISTGKMICANAGHEFPVVRHGDGDYELIKDRHGFVLAGLEGSKYKEYELDLKPGDRLFVYTDGVPEATDAHNELFGTDRMMNVLNNNKDLNCNALLPVIKKDIDRFVGEAPQFDDITMLSLELVPQKEAEMTKISVKPRLENVDNVTMFVEEKLREGGVQEKTIAVIDVAVDEIFSNIVHYSGATEATIGVRIWNGLITLRFADNGIYYDPTCKQDPDTDAPAEERNIGGLGIFIVKKTMDSMKYDYLEGFNILTLEKKIES